MATISPPVNPVLAEMVRGPVTESRHRAAIAVSDFHGKILQRWGDINQVILPRSAMKPLQAIVMAESGALAALGLSDVQLALHSASHSGEFEHVRQVTAWLAAIGRSPDDLECAPHRSLAEQWLHLSPQKCPEPSKVTNNCSGKHAGFITTALHLGVPIENYTAPDHPVQLLTRNVIAELSGEAVQNMPLACDNCGAPVYGMPIAALAVAAARMAQPDESRQIRARAIVNIISAMRTHPRLIAGTGRADTVLMSDPGFRGVTKCGAEGVYMAILPEQRIGIAIKVDDGANRAADFLLIELLHHVGAINERTRQRLAAKLNLVICNPQGDSISRIQLATSLAAARLN